MVEDHESALTVGDHLYSQVYSHTYDQNRCEVVKDGSRELIMLGFVDYLGLSHHPEVVKAAVCSMQKNGAGEYDTVEKQHDR